MRLYDAQKEATYQSLRSLLTAIALVAVVIAIGSVGYELIEGWDTIDAIYMTVVTLATVGFKEVHPLSVAGKVFTIGLIVTGVTVATYSFAVIARTIVEGELFRLRGFRKMERKIASMTGHTIVCGFGRLASLVVRDLVRSKESVVVIENDPSLVDDIIAAGAPYVLGSAYEDETLKFANIHAAKNLLALLPKDADNVYITLCARDLNPHINIIARTEGESGEQKLLRAGATRVIAPYRVAGSRVVQHITHPQVSAILEVSSVTRESPLVFEEIQVPASSPIAGQKIEDTGLRSKAGILVAAIVNPDGTSSINPDGKTVITPGCTLVVLGQPGSVGKLGEVVSS